ncbi:hypothetical protein HYD52_03915 [Mycoplasmopsis bovis]|nr:hypothetical protein [Mycoplasmopsis bovis]QQH72397.1 hypothetical protein HYD52_03915 [Mycoplasmopsis bovis]
MYLDPGLVGVTYDSWVRLVYLDPGLVGVPWSGLDWCTLIWVSWCTLSWVSWCTLILG